jgi:NDP-sugar pyrophosphorylase family protein
MKALILAAGHGTRLRPHTNHIAKPLFPVAGHPVIDITIRRLIDQGITAIIINVHHLHWQITDYIRQQQYPVPVVTRHEKDILGTGGAIKNVADFLGDAPFLVVNSDIITDIDILAVAGFHRRHRPAATLVLHDHAAFNKVLVDNKYNIVSFAGQNASPGPDIRCLAFTGIQIIDPMIMDFIPDNRGEVSSIDVYEKIISKGHALKAYVAENHYWMDIGTPENFAQSVFDLSVSRAFKRAFNADPADGIARTLLAGDGSDRRWYRITSEGRSMILADHGIHSADNTSEAAAFVAIGTHLFRKNIPVPEIYFADAFSGHVYVADLGDTHLQAKIQKNKDEQTILSIYHQVIDAAMRMWTDGKEGFDPDWTCQTPAYDRQLILEKECRYFVEAFLNTLLEMDIAYENLAEEFSELADLTLENAVFGLMHRDFQSRNIMIHNDTPWFIDFQGARTGPVQYDLASLLTDPYVNLPESIQTRLLEYSITRLGQVMEIDREKFLTGYRYCALARILQSLGAFGFLSKVKHKPFFETFIPIALENLCARLVAFHSHQFPVLTETVKNALISYHQKY